MKNGVKEDTVPDKEQFNFRRLKGRIIETYGSQRGFAEAMGMSAQMLSSRLNCHTSLSQGEIWHACILLDIAPEEIGRFFFCRRK